MLTSFFVDWIACTLPDSADGIVALSSWAARMTLTQPDQWTESKARNGYQFAVSHAKGFQAMAGRPDMGVHLIMPGSALSEGRKGKLTTTWLIDDLRRHKAHFARVDLAIDATDSSLQIDDLVLALERGQAMTAAHKWSYLQSPDGGQCLYIGSRTSERFMRIYNKSAEQAANAIKPESSDWKRAEFEAKGSMANGVAQMIATVRNVRQVATGVMLAYVDFPSSPVWQEIMSSAAGTMGKSTRRLTNTEKWLLGTVAVSLGNAIKSDPTFLARFRRAVKAAILASNSR